MKISTLGCTAAAMAALSVSGFAAADASSDGPGSGVSDLEQITVFARRDATQAENTSLGGENVTLEQMHEFNRDTVDQALLLASGTSTSMVGARNETDIWIRGFDRFRVPLYQDGIPVYLPVDNRVDFGRFSTIDVAQIQLYKGFASVIDGPGAMGGSVNLVSRVVEKPLELEGRLQSTLDSQGSYIGTIADTFVGARQGAWFVQVAGSFNRQSHFRLSDDFKPGTFQGPGDRFGSYHQDYKINFKAGYQPSQNAEYAINYIEQDGRKDNPPQDTIIPSNLLNQVRYWTWPAWNKRSLYWLSKNVFDDQGSFVKVRAYYDRFFNQLDSYDTIAYATQNTPKSFNSTYRDYAAGAIAEVDKNLLDGMDTVRASGNFRWDQHNETESTRNAPNAPFYQQPWETAEEQTWSAALENILRPWQNWQLITGLSFDKRHLIGDSQWVSASGAAASKPPFGSSFSYPVADKHALNGEIAAVYDYSATGSLHVSYADRSRFPTLFEMYSTRFGSFINNPNLQPERSHYVQAGVTEDVFGTHLVANIFYARITHAITSVALSPTVSEDENTGVERQAGFELEASRQILRALNAGVNWSYLSRSEISGGAVPTDTPNHRVFAHLDWEALPGLDLVPTVDMVGRRWLQNGVNMALYYRGGSYALLGLKASYHPLDFLTVEVGATNLADRNFVIEDGYNGPGREYFANVRVAL